ncbi:MAG: phosphotransferase [Acidimicrobiales bacterium]
MDPIAAAVAIVSKFGIVVEDPVVLHDSNNTLVWLRPHAVVAKVATGHHHRLDLDMDVCRHLVACDAPAVPPADAVPPVLHRYGGYEATFWTYEHQVRSKEEPDEADLAASLHAVHRALDTFPGKLPDLDDELEAVAAVLSEPARAPALSTMDRELLVSALSLLRGKLEAHASAPRRLHGSPHDGNVLLVDGHVAFIDFETACQGPLEWDLAHMGDGAVGAYPGSIDVAVLGISQGLVSVKTAAWCWAKYEHKDLRWHAHHHLAQVRRLAADRDRGDLRSD